MLRRRFKQTQSLKNSFPEKPGVYEPKPVASPGAARDELIRKPAGRTAPI